MIKPTSIRLRYGLFAVGLTVCSMAVETSASLSHDNLNSGSTTPTATMKNKGSGGNLPAVRRNGRGQFMALDPTKTYLVNNSTNKPVFITGEQAFELAINLASDSDIDHYLSTRRSQGFNFLWVGATDRAYVLNYPNNALGYPPFTNMSFPFRGMNEAYFKHLDDVIQRAATFGFEVLLNAAFVGSGPTYCFDSTGWCLELQSADTRDLTAFGAYLGSRYKDYPNIIWMLGGDLDLTHFPNLRDKMLAILNGIKSTDRNHLVTVENEPPHAAASQDLWPPHTWDLNFFYHDPPNMAVDANAAYARRDSLPMFLGEGKIDHEGASDLTMRTQNYQAVLGGATLGFVYGSCIIWPFGFNATNVNCQKSEGQTWQSLLTSPGSIGSEHLGQLMRSREFWKMVPDLHHMVVRAGYGSGDSITVTSRTRDGQTIIAYIPNGNGATLRVDMHMIVSSSGQAKAWWFNPSSGVAALIATYRNAGIREFTPPSSSDWVLVIDDASAKLPPPGSGDL